MPYKEGKTWRAVLKLNGERYQKTGFATKKAAKEWEKDRLKKLTLPTLQPGPALLAICSKYLLYSERYSKGVQDEKSAVCARIIEYWGAKTIVGLITVEMAEEYLSIQKSDRSANASNKDRKNLHAMWVKACKTWGVKSNPFAETQQFSHDRKTQYTPTSEDVGKVLLASSRAERLFLMTYIQSGARRSEIFRWTWTDDINFERRGYRLGTRKTRDGSMRYTWKPMSEEIYQELLWWWKARPVKNSQYVFVVDRKGPNYGKPYKHRRRLLPKLCKRAEVKEFGYHALRRFCASMLVDGHKSLKAVQEWLGHASLRTTELYVQNIHSDMHDVAESVTMDKILGAGTRNGTRENKGG